MTTEMLQLTKTPPDDHSDVTTNQNNGLSNLLFSSTKNFNICWPFILYK